ncbi:hypothetical protein KDU71_08425 [Carboxylicivirga sediminis]|uniref:Beta-carotene 15,15'-monooxygenase n=1 Tax=Carboxylicivirga sediminis TaxID=2006564 RepID=A0A941F381_9BACT|nr:hypothetical protein [Carboxylicivirga sediminis]MBR8535582.1 hypothetical protein [Carboxylicivirga sediminis]
MLFRTLNRNDIVALALMPLLLIGFWINTLLFDQSPSFPYDHNPMPLWDLVIGVLKSNHLLASVISLLIALIMMFSVNRVVNRYNLFNGQTNLPGFIYMLLVSAYLMAQKLHPVWFFTPLLILAIERLFSAAGQRKAMTWCFEASFALSLGTLFYAKGIYFMAFLWMIMFILRLLTIRSFMASIIGLALPYLFSFAYYFWFDQADVFLETVVENFISPIAFFNHTIYSQIYNGFIIFLVFVSILSVVRILPAIKIITRKHYRIFIWLIVLCVVAAITPYYSLEVMPIWAIGTSIVLGRFLSLIRRRFIQELILFIIVAITIAGQFLI